MRGCLESECTFLLKSIGLGAASAGRCMLSVLVHMLCTDLTSLIAQHVQGAILRVTWGCGGVGDGTKHFLPPGCLPSILGEKKNIKIEKLVKTTSNVGEKNKITI